MRDVLAWLCSLVLLAGCGGDDARPLMASGPASDVDTLAADDARFAADLLQRLPRDANVAFSPHSISVAMAMTATGARGETLDQLRHALRFSLPDDRLHPAMRALEERLRQASADGVELAIANALWGQDGTAFRQSFLDVLADGYGAPMQTVDYRRNAEGARTTINRWVAGETRDRIRDLLPPQSLDDLTRLVLVNAVYLKAPWFEPFLSAATRPAPFHRTDGTSIEANMMRDTRQVPYAQGEGWQAVELPYQGRRLRMLFVLPREGRLGDVDPPLDQLIATVTRELRPTPVRLAIPTFKIASSVTLKRALSELGMPLAFDRERADFSGITAEERLVVDDVYHQAFVDVDEQGTEAAAATGSVLKALSALAERAVFDANRPFLFAVRDSVTGALLFLGRVVDPTG